MSHSDTPTAYAERLKIEARQRTLRGWEFPVSDEFRGAIGKVGVVGAGVMGSGIAHWCAMSGLTVVLRDVQPEFVERGLNVIRGLCETGVKREQLTAEAAQQALGRITTTTGWAGFADCDLVIEAIVENVAAKQKLFFEIAQVVGPDVLLATNTSALPIEEIFGGLPNPARSVGLHFFNPVGRMPLVELIIGRQTGAGTATAALDFVKLLGKSPVICRSAPGFLVTRVLFFYLNAACRLGEEGVPPETIDAAMREWGWPMGPMRLIDEVGVDVTDFIFGEMAHYFPARFQRTTICAQLLGAGLKGRKNGAGSGFYAYEGRSSLPNPVVAAFLPGSTTPVTVDIIQDQLMGVMIAEAKRCLDEGVIKTPEDVDFALLSGAGFPVAKGGLMHWSAQPGH
jgi:3-hydroxyacyl-CoA dehydrogenase / enoyl-CoA hydratase / 3-hydroxybutyryl-CoA epimerase